MWKKQGISKTIAALAVVLIVLAAGLIGTIYYYGITPPQPTTIITTQPPTIITSVITTGGSTVTSVMTTTKPPTTIITTAPTTTIKPTVAEPDFVKDNIMIIEMGSTFRDLDPHVSYYALDYMMLENVYEKIVWFDGTKATEVVPWLAESFTIVDPAHYDVVLRKGITFQDGTPFNATAIYFSLNRLLVMDGTDSTGVHGSQAAWIIQQYLDTSLSSTLTGEDQPYDKAWVDAVLAQNFVEIIDDYHVRLNLKTPSSVFPLLIAGEWAGIVSPTFVINHDYPQAWADPDPILAYFYHQAGNGTTYLDLCENGAKAGTGPYYFESVDTATYYLVLKARDDYWGGPEWMFGNGDMEPTIKEIRFSYVDSPTTRILDLLAGKATRADVPSANMFSVVERVSWLEQGKLVPLQPTVKVYGPEAGFNSRHMAFAYNTTDAAGKLLSFQPQADIRFRQACASLVNMTDIAVNVLNRLSVAAEMCVPPGTAPEGSYNPALDQHKMFPFNPAKATELLLDMQANPLTKFTFVNGTSMPDGLIDNSFGPDNPKTVTFLTTPGNPRDTAIVTQIVSQLTNIIQSNNLGLTININMIPWGQHYRAAARHQLTFWPAGWVADYNWVLNWLLPHYPTGGTWSSWNNYNIKIYNDLYEEAVAADEAGDITRLLEISDQMNSIANERCDYIWSVYDLQVAYRSSWLTNIFYNPNFPFYDYWAIQRYVPP